MSENETTSNGNLNSGKNAPNENEGSEVSISTSTSTSTGTGETPVLEKNIEKKILEARKKAINPLSEAEKAVLVSDYTKQAIEGGLVAYDAYAIKKAFPKSFAAFQDYINETAHLPVDTDTIVGIMLYSGRTVIFDFFDKKKIFVNIIGYENNFYYRIENIGQSKETYSNRTNCEVEAFMEAFTILEKQI